MFVLASMGDAEDDHVLISGQLAAGLFIPLHRHDDVECLHIVTGSLDVYLGDLERWFTLQPGESILINPDVAHAIRNVTAQPVSALVIVTVKLAWFLRDLGAIVAAVGRERSREERMESLRDLVQRYDYWLAPAEQSDAIRNLPSSMT
jgi:anti-sigma factor ChrR (cupin superfamily)